MFFVPFFIGEKTMRYTFSNDLGTLFTIILAIGFIINLVLAFIIIFLERNRRTASSTWAWLFVLFVLPLIGFILYLFFGRTVSARKLNKNNGKVLTDFDGLLKQQIESFDKGNYGTDNKQVQKHHDLVRTFRVLYIRSRWLGPKNFKSVRREIETRSRSENFI